MSTSMTEVKCLCCGRLYVGDSEGLRFACQDCGSMAIKRIVKLCKKCKTEHIQK